MVHRGKVRRAIASLTLAALLVPGMGAAMLAMDVVHVVVQRHRYQIERCYRDALARSPGLRGRVVLRWVVGTDGTVTAATVTEASPGLDEVGHCMVIAVGQWHFPAPGGDRSMTLVHPFTFVP